MDETNGLLIPLKQAAGTGHVSAAIYKTTKKILSVFLLKRQIINNDVHCKTISSYNAMKCMFIHILSEPSRGLTYATLTARNAALKCSVCCRKIAQEHGKTKQNSTNGWCC